MFDDLVCLDCDGDAPLTLARRQPQAKQYHSRGIDAGSELVALATTPLHDYG
ncbi:hypothetical protein ACVWWI_001534 [Bradyrhizobium sp. USDA 3686]|uniref:hypothetical protein n=1 Tax=Bradyrhizobium sp. WU425 TaxID=187029 RepID=UPI0002DE23F5|nr:MULTISPECIES: hypothetical protein [Bradyrhizobium]MBM7485140.1 hypothetical protein [Bradyrhizobium canariense]MCS3762351.1 hypothetical protein [Bradyrhizobium centrosematis]MCS3775020.1 hypothetical protein [Bradyrhizobium centrosematis]UFW73754.1 hypothetical protein BcanWU425_08410 [Bradyrhizobium canariense]